MRFTFRSSSGRICCDSTEKAHLCDACRARAAATTERTTQMRMKTTNTVDPNCPVHGTTARAAAIPLPSTAAPRPTVAAITRSFEPPDTWAADIAKRRAADETSDARFAAQHREQRQAEFAAEYAAAAVRHAAQPAPRATDLSRYAAPSSWAPAIAAIRAREAR